MRTLTMDYQLGSISSITKEALEIAQKVDCIVRFEFNGVWVVVMPEDTVEEVVKMTRYRVRSGQRDY